MIKQGVKTLCGIAAALGVSMVLSASTLLAQEGMGPEADEPVAEEEKDSNYELCARYRADIDADLGEVLRAGCEPTLEQMSALMDNPIGNVAMMFNQVDAYKMEDPITGTTANQFNYMMLFQFPKKLNDDWNLINRVVVNVPSVPLDQGKIDDFEPPPGINDDYGTGPGDQPITDPVTGLPLPIDLFDGRETGLGDTYYVGLFAPNDPIKLSNGAKFLWGLGFDVGMDTASEDILGTGKWSAGPSALAVYMGETFKGGALVQHYWDFAGDDDRSDVNMTNIQYLYYWSLDEVTSIGAGPNFIINWEQDKDNRYTLPVGIGINRTFQFGKVPVRMGLEYFHTVVEPDDIVGSDWSVRFYVIPAVPSALFDWMQ